MIPRIFGRVRNAALAALYPALAVSLPASSHAQAEIDKRTAEADASTQPLKGPVAEEAEPSQVKISGAPGEGLTIRIDDSYSLNIKSRIQLRYQLNVSREDAAGERVFEQYASIGTARLWLGGNVFSPKLTYLIQLAVAGRDFREDARSPLYDAYLDYRWHRDLNLRLGQFFVPFDRLRTIREWALQMSERARPVQELTLDRDVGVMLYSDRFLGDGSPLAFKAGVFGGGGANLSMGKEPGALFVARLEVRPLGPIDDDLDGDLARRTNPGLALGAGIAQNQNTNRHRSTTGTRFVGGTADYTHLAVDAVFKWWGFALQGEYLYRQASTDQISSVAADGSAVVEFTRSGQGVVVQASYAIPQGVELVGRYSRLFAKDGTDPSFVTEVEERGQELGAGLNYYLNGHKLKLQGDWIAYMPPGHFEQAEHTAHALLDVTF